ncbi:LamG-like jellyroll fold domain-containing protein [Acinetobacter sp. ANC 4641]|uniref:LamG-like jellyroll fold domain-containing protein n=1 Tax=Acinetobacter sp. ANC 4641 TaxID=2529847 RepID=UPI001038A82C|nr:LamG-like jellyroll fold domain-containing protein [Acinetobacter sp. ANC 4641]TCB12675.1 hypothetical protein E0H78_05680 [Acinetobacter sp. ANC 4641]
MSSINLAWSADGNIDSYTIYRSESPIDINNLPVPIASGVTSKSYSDTTVVTGVNYFYRVASISLQASKISNEISSYAGGDLYFSSVDLLIFADATNQISTNIVDKSSSPKTISLSGDTKIVKSKFGGMCVLVNQYAKWTTSGAQLLTSDFTIEFWYYSTAGGTANGRILSYATGSSGSLLINKTSNTAASDLNILINNGSYQTLLTTSGSPITGTGWQHICLMRSAGDFYLFVDGVLKGSSTAYKTYSITDAGFSYNGWQAGNTDYHLGLFGSCRVTKGLCRYALTGFNSPVSEFPTIAANDASFSSVDLLLIPSSTAMLDKSNNNRTITAVGLAYYVPEKKFDDGVVFFDGDIDGISSTITALGTNDFTLEFFINVKGTSKSFPRIGQIGSADSSNGCVFVTSIGTTWGTDFHFWVGSAYQAFVGFSGLNKYQWYHICVMRKSGAFYVFVDGVLKASNSSAPFNTYNFTTTLLILGKGAVASSEVQSAYSGIRLTRIARYNTAGFTVPSKKFPRST